MFIIDTRNNYKSREEIYPIFDFIVITGMIDIINKLITTNNFRRKNQQEPFFSLRFSYFLRKVEIYDSFSSKFIKRKS